MFDLVVSSLVRRAAGGGGEEEGGGGGEGGGGAAGGGGGAGGGASVNGSDPGETSWQTFDIVMTVAYLFTSLLCFVVLVNTTRDRSTRGWKLRMFFLGFLFLQTLGTYALFSLFLTLLVMVVLVAILGCERDPGQDELREIEIQGRRKKGWESEPPSSFFFLNEGRQAGRQAGGQGGQGAGRQEW